MSRKTTTWEMWSKGYDEHLDRLVELLLTCPEVTNTLQSQGKTSKYKKRQALYLLFVEDGRACRDLWKAIRRVIR